jgi:integrase
MSIFKRGSVWWIRFTAPNGREIRESTKTADRRQAQELHDTRKAALWRQCRLGEAPRYSWQQAVVRWIEDHPERKGLANVQLHLRQAHPALGYRFLDEVNAEAVADYIRERRGAGVMNSTINQGLSAIRAVLHAAHRWGWLAAVPVLQNLPVGERRIRWLTREEADRLVAELPVHLAAMARFSLATGLRETNVCRLEWQQVDVDRRMAWIYGDQAKAGKSITIPLNAEAVCVLREQQGQHPRWVFPYAGRAVRKARGTAWSAALQRSGIENFRWHDLRHTWASWHVQAGTPLPVIKELGGWASLDMVLRYAHLGADHLAEHAERISRPRLIRTNQGTTQEKNAATG